MSYPAKLSSVIKRTQTSDVVKLERMRTVFALVCKMFYVSVLKMLNLGYINLLVKILPMKASIVGRFPQFAIM